MNLKELLKNNRLEELFSGDNSSYKLLQDTLEELKKHNKVLLLTCSLRYDKEVPKSSMLAILIDEYLGKKSKIIDVSKLLIRPCTGNISRNDGNSCGIKASMLQDRQKNPSGDIRCWVSYEHSDDDLWKIANPIFEADVVIFFSSIRWGQANAIYQNLIERLSWLENRKTTLNGGNLLENKQSGFICVGHNWNGEEVVRTQKQVHDFFGFTTNDKLYWNWQFTSDIEDETQESYKKSYKEFKKDFKIFMV